MLAPMPGRVARLARWTTRSSKSSTTPRTRTCGIWCTRPFRPASLGPGRLVGVVEEEEEGVEVEEGDRIITINRVSVQHAL